MGALYPKEVCSSEDRQEYGAFIAGLPLVNRLFFKDNLSRLKRWIEEGCPETTWEDMQRRMKGIAFHIAANEDSGEPERRVYGVLLAEAEKKAPDAAQLQNAWNEILSWAKS